MNARAAVLLPFPAATSASDRFRRFGPEIEGRVRDAISRSGHEPGLMRIIDAWHRVRPIEVYDFEDMYYQALGPVGGLACRKEDIEMFSLTLRQFENEATFDMKAGLFLSALINDSPDESFTIHTSHLDARLHYIGSYNKKDIIVNGHAGDLAASDMGGGSILIHGDAGGSLAIGLRGGIIRVDGNAGEKAGFMMKGGSIHISGDAGPESGFNMYGGELHVDGRFALPSALFQEISTGKIYHKGALIWPREGNG
jgi:hypothetical protein